MSIDFEKLQRDPVSRRAFLQRMGAAGLGLAAVNLLQGCGGGGGGNNNNNGGGGDGVFPGIKGRSRDIKALNYALTLEILEADLYRQALNVASGKPQNPNPNQETLDAFATYTLAVPAGTFPGPGADTERRRQVGFLYLKQFAFVEAAHRDFLRAAISAAGATPVARNPKGYKFTTASPGTTIAEILTSILPLEETGVRAYLGAVPLINDGGLVQTAGTIYSTECRHSAAVRYILNQNDTGPSTMNGDIQVATGTSTTDPSVLDQLFEKALQPSTVINAVQAYIVS